MKSLFASRTFWVAILQGVAGVLVIVVAQEPNLGVALLAKSCVDILLRLMTDKAVVL